MPEFTAKDVQALRRATGAGMLDAKKALEETGGDMDEATKWLRVKGLGSADKRLHVHPGRHGDVPLEEFEASERFLAQHLGQA